MVVPFRRSMSPRPTEIVLLLPRHCSAKPTMKRNDSCVIICLCCADPRIVWNGLHPLLFQSSHSIAVRATKLLLSQHSFYPFNPFSEKDSPLEKSINDTTIVSENTETDELAWETRVLQIPKFKNRRAWFAGNKATTTTRITLWIQPPLTVKLHSDRLFGAIVLRWERLYLQLQSLAAFLATLGGGYFLCRQLATAVVLARRQRQLALLLGDHETADKCTINEAYNCIHAGYFHHAMRLIRSVEATVLARNEALGGRQLLLAMCSAAKVFCRRVKACRRKLLLHPSSSSLKGISSTVDDYQRIRIGGNDRLLIKKNITHKE